MDPAPEEIPVPFLAARPTVARGHFSAGRLTSTSRQGSWCRGELSDWGELTPAACIPAAPARSPLQLTALAPLSGGVPQDAVLKSVRDVPGGTHAEVVPADRRLEGAAAGGPRAPSGVVEASAADDLCAGVVNVQLQTRAFQWV